MSADMKAKKVALVTGTGGELGAAIAARLESDGYDVVGLETTPMKRAARPSEIANVVAFLASDEASYITGTTVDVNGGL